MKAFFSLFLFVLVGAACATPRAPASVRPSGVNHRTVMVQLFEWPWRAVGEECEKVLGPGGFAAVQVSPAEEHIVVNGAPWWERYQPASYRIASRSGSEAEYAEMVRRCRAAGVDIYADVVLNHMNAQPSGVGFAGARFSHYQYDGLWQSSDFHHCGRNGNDGLRNFTDLYELQNCELLGMADLNTSSPNVQTRQADYLNHLLELGVAGFRVDAAKHMAASDLEGIFRKLTRPHYRVLELILSPGEPVSLADYLPVGDVDNFAYSYLLGEAFAAGDLSRLPTLYSRTGIGTDAAVVFLENHDLERRPDAENLLAYRRDRTLNKLGTVFLLTWPYGYPEIFSGYSYNNPDAGAPIGEDGLISSPLVNDHCLEPWTCTQRLSWLRNLVAFRNLTDGAFSAGDIWTKGAGTLAFGRGDVGHVVLTLEKQAQALDVPTHLRAGRYCNQAADDPRSDCALVDEGHVLHVKLRGPSAFVALDAGRAGKK